MFERIEKHDVFPTLLLAFYLQDSAKLNRDTLKSIRNLASIDRDHQAEAGFPGQSVPDLQERKEFDPFVKRVRSAIEAALGEYGVEFKSYTITDCWANMSNSGDSHPLHNHPNNYLSGVYYVAAPENCGRIVFYDPRPQTSVIFPRPERYNQYNINKIKITPRPGMMLMFPSWLMHSVEANTGDGERVSIAFNMMFDHDIGVPLARTGS